MQLLKRWRFSYYQKQASPLLGSFYAKQALLLGKPLAEIPLMALDLETTGLNPKTDQIISVGLVPIDDGKLILKNAHHQLIKISGSVGQSATIHGILDVDLNDKKLNQASFLPWLLELISGRILVAHHASFDIAFLAALAQKYYQQPLHLPVIDTLAIAQKQILKNYDTIPKGSLRLNACRSRYHLPKYLSHNALIDAIACGELLLAQSAIDRQGNTVVDEYLTWL